MRKKKVLIHSNFCKMFTGFGKHKKNLLKYLYKTGKYEIIELSNGFQWSDEKIKYTPWDNYGMLPDDPELLQQAMSDQVRKNAAGYGAEMIDHAIKELNPDIYLGIEDIWAFRPFFDKPWWNKINCIIHTTLDSLPILKDAVEAANKIKNYYVWASFAEKALNKLGHNHVKTIHGSVDTENFYKLDKASRLKLRKFFKTDDNFIIGFVFRNQLRKSVPNLLDGFKLFNQKNPEAKAKLLLHTHWSEGWNIPQLLTEKEIDFNSVLTTYFCKNCSHYNIRPFSGQGVNCVFCKSEKSCDTTNVKNGVDERQLNEIYNLMDVYCHPFTSGGQELPIQEAKLNELITLVTNYSCGEDSCSEESGGFPLNWSEYREPGTQFIKATTSSEHISEQLEYVYKMPESEKNKLGKKSRKYIIDNYSIEVIGRKFEELFDSLPYIDENLELEQETYNPYYSPDNSLDDKKWVESLYSNMLGSIDSKGVEHWMERLKKDLKRDNVLMYFRKVAKDKLDSVEFEKIKTELLKNKEEKRIAFIQPDGEENVILSSSLLSSIKIKYPDYKIYYITKSQNFDLINSNPNVDELIKYSQEMADPIKLEGKGDKKGLFDIVFAPHLSINNNYYRNCKDSLEYNIYESN
jgi:glycosyltransferase involved in cell wall biosynthesis